jgi:hypothetical protein
MRETENPRHLLGQQCTQTAHQDRELARREEVETVGLGGQLLNLLRLYCTNLGIQKLNLILDSDF